MTSLIVLEGRATAIVLEVSADGFPVWRHWGAKVALGTQVESWSKTVETPTFSLDINQPFRLFPLFGRGWMGPSALDCHRAGQAWAPGAHSCETRRGQHDLSCRVADAAMGVTIEHNLSIDPETDVLALSTKLTNSGADRLDVAWLAAGVLPIAPHAQRVESLSGRHNAEFVPVSDRLSRSGWRRQNKRGLTSHDCPPVARVLGTNAGENEGSVWAAQLAWSGNHCQSVDWHDDGRWIWMAGEWFAPGEVRLEPGQTLASPDWLATFSPNGRNGVAQNFQADLRKRSPLWRNGRLSPRPVHINTWEALYFDHSETELKELADAAAELGVERFVLDDGWFAGRDDDTTSLGDWTPDTNKYPQGLKPLADHVTRLGMQFGLWVEPEMINPDSELFRAHPDWILRLGPDLPLTARNQLVLDLTRDDVRQHLFTALDGLLRLLPISYLKWDHNRDLTEAGSAGRPAFRRQVLGAYDLIDRVRAAHPDIEIEACAGGGGRIDAGILSRTHRVWTSDCLDSVSRIEMHRQFLGYFPPETMGAHVGVSPAHATGRSQSVGFRAAVALPGHFGLELDPRKLTDQDKANIRDWIALYKSVRQKMHEGRVWQGSAEDGIVWIACGTPQAFILFIYRTAPSQLRFPPLLRLPFLAGAPEYSLTRIDPGGAPGGKRNPLGLSLRGSCERQTGSWLREVGLQLPNLKAESCLVLEAKVL